MIQKKLKNTKLLLLDVDGVLTDGTITYDDNGIETKSFNARDGLGIKLLMRNGIRVGIVTARAGKALKHRCRDLGMTMIFDGISNKAEVLPEIIETSGFEPEEIAFVGDDLVDLPLMKKVGLPIAVADAHEIILRHAHMATTAKGGKGAVREVAEAILKAGGFWDRIKGGL